MPRLQPSESKLAEAAAEQVSDLCIADLADVEGGKSSPVAADARQVCAALGAGRSPRIREDIELRSKNELLSLFGAVNRASRSVVYFTGHGEFFPQGDGGALAFRTSGGPTDRLWLSEALGELGRRAAAEPPGEGSTVVILNTCDSGYGDLRKAPQDTALLGSGYGRVPGGVSLASPLIGGTGSTEFGGWVAQALDGAADRGASGNCDGIVTDEEIAEYVNQGMHRRARISSVERQWRPRAVLKRNVDYPIPAVLLQGQADCGLPPFESSLQIFPPEVGDAARAYQSFLRGQGRAMIWGPRRPSRRFLLVSGEVEAQALRDDLATQVKPWAERLGWRVQPMESPEPSRLVAAARTLSFLELLWVRVRSSALGGWFVELTDLKTNSLLWASHQPNAVGPMAPSAAVGPSPRRPGIPWGEELVQRLPRRFSLISLGEPPQAALLLRVEGAIPQGLRAVPFDRWLKNDFRGALAVPLTELARAPCPTTLGQCFQADALPFAKDYQQWLVELAP